MLWLSPSDTDTAYPAQFPDHAVPAYSTMSEAVTGMPLKSIWLAGHYACVRAQSISQHVISQWQQIKVVCCYCSSFQLHMATMTATRCERRRCKLLARAQP